MWQCVAVRLLLLMVRTSLLMRVANGKRLKSDWKSANISLSYLDATCRKEQRGEVEVKW